MEKKKYLNFEGITISSRDYGEFDKIFNILTPDTGVVTCIVKRMKKNNQNFDSIDIFQKMDFKASVRENLWLIYESKNKFSWFERPIDLAKLISSNIMAELCIYTNSINENNKYVYHLFNLCLSLISKNKILLSLIYFQVKILLSEGIFPEINICLLCNTSLKPGNYYLAFKNGSLICPNCPISKNNSVLLEESEIRLLKFISKNEISSVDIINNKLSKNANIKLYKKLSEYLKYHTNQELKSEKIFFSSLN